MKVNDFSTYLEDISPINLLSTFSVDQQGLCKVLKSMCTACSCQ